MGWPHADFAGLAGIPDLRHIDFPHYKDYLLAFGYRLHDPRSLLVSALKYKTILKTKQK